MKVMDDEKLVMLVRKNSELYNFRDPKYSNHVRKDNCWRKIAEQMQRSETDCKDRWKRLRDCYRKAIKLRKTRIGDATLKKPWKFQREMSFLLPFINEDLEKNSNLQSPQEDLSTNKEDGDGIVYEENGGESEGDRASPSVRTSPSPKSVVEVTTAKRKCANRHLDSVSAVLQKYIDAKTRQEKKSPLHDSLTHFFLSMAETVRTFPPNLQIDVKQKVFSVVSNAEIASLNLQNDFPVT